MRFAAAAMAWAMILAGAAADARASQLADCLRGSDPDAVIRACSAVLHEGNLDSRAQSRAYTRRGIAHHKKNDYARAILDHSRAIGLDPANAEAFASRGDVRADLATGLTAAALPSWTLTEHAMRASREGFADHLQAFSLGTGRR